MTYGEKAAAIIFFVLGFFAGGLGGLTLGAQLTFQGIEQNEVYAKQDNGTSIQMEIDNHASLNEVLEEFENFLRVCGYIIDYNQALDLVNTEDD